MLTLKATLYTHTAESYSTHARPGVAPSLAAGSEAKRGGAGPQRRDREPLRKRARRDARYGEAGAQGHARGAPSCGERGSRDRGRVARSEWKFPSEGNRTLLKCGEERVWSRDSARGRGRPTALELTAGVLMPTCRTTRRGPRIRITSRGARVLTPDFSDRPRSRGQTPRAV